MTHTLQLLGWLLVLAGVLLLIGAAFNAAAKVRLEWLGWAFIVAGALLLPGLAQLAG